MLPAGITKAQAIEAARARGDDTFADLLSGMNVVPGVGIDMGDLGRVLLAVLVLYVFAFLFSWSQGLLLERRGAAHHPRDARGGGGQAAPPAAELLRPPAPR